MEYEFSKSFIREIKSFDLDENFARQLAGKIKEIEKADSIGDVSGLENIRGRKVFYRFKITSGRIVYRVGLKVLHNIVWLTIIDTYKKRFYDRI